MILVGHTSMRVAWNLIHTSQQQQQQQKQNKKKRLMNKNYKIRKITTREIREK